MRIADAPPGNVGQGKEEGTGLKRPGGEANVLRLVGKKGNPGQWGHEENQGPTEQHSGGKIQGIQHRTGRGRCDQARSHKRLRK